MSDGSVEAHTAAQWWADRIAESSDPAIGDREQDGVMKGFRSLSTRPAPTAEQIEAFRAHLTQTIVAMLHEQVSGWDSAVAKGPDWGSAFRTIAVDYGADPILREALNAAGIDDGPLGPVPMKTCMWVNPGQVKAALGYRGGIEDVPLLPLPHP